MNKTSPSAFDFWFLANSLYQNTGLFYSFFMRFYKSVDNSKTQSYLIHSRYLVISKKMGKL